MDFEKQEEKKNRTDAGLKGAIREEKTYRLKQRLRILLELPVTDPQQKEILKKEGLPVRYRDHLQLVAWNLYQKALGGDMAAIREMRGILEEGEPIKGKNRKQTAEQSQTPPVVIIDDVR